MTDSQAKKLLHFHGQGMLDTEIAAAMHVPVGTIRAWRRKFGLTNNFDSGREIDRQQSRTICWTCRNACGQCAWSRSFRPVKGWEARQTLLYASDPDGGTVSYEVIRCPEYEPDRRTQ